MEQIRVVVDDIESLNDEGQKFDAYDMAGKRQGFVTDSIKSLTGKVITPGVDKLKNSLSEFTTSLSSLFADIKAVGDFELKQVQVQVEINAEGQVLLVGKAGVKGAITLTFAPKTPPPTPPTQIYVEGKLVSSEQSDRSQ